MLARLADIARFGRQEVVARGNIHVDASTTRSTRCFEAVKGKPIRYFHFPEVEGIRGTNE